MESHDGAQLIFNKPVLGFAAYSGTGKTTLLEKLLPLMKLQGLRVAMIKQTHHDFDIDKPGKDSYRLRKAGAGQMLIASDKRCALITEFGETKDQALLKRRYEEIFLSEWEAHRNYLAHHLGVTGWREINYEGTRAVEGMGSRYRSGKENGGLKILFHDNAGKDQAFIWMRGSKTEPVFRILADVRGRYPEIEKYLLEWQTSMIRKADR